MSEIQPILVPIKQASAIIGKSRRCIYELIAAKELQAVKSGRNTLVVFESLKSYAARLPVVEIKPRVTPRRRAASVAA